MLAELNHRRRRNFLKLKLQAKPNREGERIYLFKTGCDDLNMLSQYFVHFNLSQITTKALLIHLFTFQLFIPGKK